MELFLDCALFVLGLIMLIKGGDWFVDGATGLAHRFKLPEILIGATVVSIGTTLPEVMVSAGGAMAGNGAMAYGNAIGSIICNTALICAITLTVRPSKTDRRSLILPVSFFFLSAAFYVFIAYFLGEFPRWAGIVLLGIFITYMVLVVLNMKSSTTNEDAESDEPEIGAVSSEKLPFFGELWAQIRGKRTSVVREMLLLVIGAAVIAFGADFLVDSATTIATTLGVPQTVISLTIVALGTSLPELVTAITSLAKGHGSLSLGNIIGANLFNLVLVSGVSVAINPFAVPTEATLFGINASFILDIPLMLTVMLILTVPPLIRGKLSRVQGISLLALYAAFIVVQTVVIPLAA